MTTNKVFIPALWINDEQAITNISQGVSMSQVSALVSTEILKSTSGLLKVDGTRPMAGLLDINQNDLVNVKTVLPPKSGDLIAVDGSFDLKHFDIENAKNIRNVEVISSPSGKSLQINSNIDMNNYNLQNIQGLGAISGNTLALRSDVTSYGNIDLRNENEIINSKVPESDNGLARFKTVDNLYYSLENIFEKSTNSLYDANQVVTASSHHYSWGIPENAFDLSSTTQWLVSNSGKNLPAWIKVEYPNKYSIYKIKLYPRQASAGMFQYVKRWTLEGSNDDSTYDYIFNKIENVTTPKETEFKVSKPYKYFKLSTEGQGQHGFSNVQLFPATVMNDTPTILNSGVIQTGDIPFVWRNTNGKLVMAHTENLKLNAKGELSSKLGNIAFADNINMNGNLIENVALPGISSDGVNKLYVDTNFLSINNFNIYQALPGLPVTSGLTMTFIPSLNNCVIDANGKVLSITDQISSIQLASGNTLDPIFRVDSDHVNYIEFDNNDLFKDNVSASQIGVDGNSTIFFVANTKRVAQQSQFSWMKGKPGSFDASQKLNVHLPWSNSIVYFDIGSGIGGRMQVSYAGNNTIIGSKGMWSFRKSGNSGQIWRNEHSQLTGNMTKSLVASDLGRFTIGKASNANYYSTMDFYGILFYNRALSDVEMRQMHMYLIKLFKI